MAIAIAWLVLFVATSAHADLDPPEGKVWHAAVFHGLDRFPDERFFVVADGRALRVMNGEPAWAGGRSSPRMALWSVRASLPEDDAIDAAWLHAALKNESGPHIARGTLEGYASLKDAKSAATHLLTVYDLESINGDRLLLERKRVETYESPAEQKKGEAPFAWYYRAHAANQLPRPALTETPMSVPRARWGWAVALVVGVGVGLLAALLVQRALRQGA